MSNETKQTAVDKIVALLNKKGFAPVLTEEEIKFFKEMEKEQMIDFASWIAKSEWMSIWVVDKWMWECQKENSNTNYKTDKELFDIYYNETYGSNK